MKGYIISVLVLLLAGCAGERDIRDYYFPARELVNADGKVYAYQNIGSQPLVDTIYWYYLGVDLDTALYLSITRYGPDLSPQQLAREEIRNDGVRLRELTVLAVDTAGYAVPTEMEVIYDRAFPFYLSEASEPSGYRVKGRMTPGDDAVTYVTLDRRYRGDTTVFVLGEERDALIFDLAGEVSLRDPEDGDISPTFSGYEIYAEGLGLVEYFRSLGRAGTLGGKLRRRIPMKEFATEQLPRPE